MVERNFTRRPTQTKKPVFQGPVREGIDLKKFSETGKSEQIFTPAKGRRRRGRGGGTSPAQQAQAEKIRLDNLKIAEEKARLLKLKNQLTSDFSKILSAQQKISSRGRRTFFPGSKEFKTREGLEKLSSNVKTRIEKTVANLKTVDDRLLKTVEETQQRRRVLQGERGGFLKPTQSKLDREAETVALVIIGGVAGLGLGVTQVAGFLSKSGKTIFKSSVINVKNLPENNKKFIKSVINDRKNVNRVIASDTKKFISFIKKTPQRVKAGVKAGVKGGMRIGEDFVTLAKISRFEAIAVLGTEILLLGGTGKGLKVVGKLTKPASSVVKRNLAQAGAKVTQVVKRTKVTPTKIIIKGKGKEDIVLKKVGTTKRESLAEQLNLKGDLTVVSAQADRLVGLIRRRKTLRKPIPGEANFPKRTKELLKKFDKKTINSKELVELQNKVQILERSFFADPKGRVRLGRLGLDEKDIIDATTLDIIKGNFRIFKNRPQVLVFPKVKPPKIPKSLKDIEDKIKSGKTLTLAEWRRYEKYQLKISGKFKPLGFLSRESELTLAPGEIIKRIRLLTRVEANGKLIPIIEARVVKASPKTRALMNKVRVGKRLTNKEKLDLKKRFKKETGGLGTASRRVGKPKPLLRIKRKITTLAIRPIKVGRKKPRTPGRITGRIPPTGRTPGRPIGGTPRRPIGGTPRRTQGKPPLRPTLKKTPPPRKPLKKAKTVIAPKRFGKKTLKKAREGWFIKVKRKGKIVNLNARPLTIEDAKDYLAYRVDNRIVRSGWFEPLGKTKNIVKLPKDIKGYFNKNKRKLRPFKIRVGKKKAIRNGYIEKRKFIQDTRGEKRQLKLARAKSKRRKVVKSRSKRKKRR